MLTNLLLFLAATVVAQPVLRVVNELNETSFDINLVSKLHHGAGWYEPTDAPTSVAMFYLGDLGEGKAFRWMRANISTAGVLSGLVSGTTDEIDVSGAVVGAMVRGFDDMWVCTDHLFYASSDGETTAEVTAPTAHPTYRIRACASDPLSATATILFETDTGSSTWVLCRMPLTMLPATTIALPYNASYCSSEFAAADFSFNATGMGMVVTPGALYAMATGGSASPDYRAVLFDMTACLADDATHCYAVFANPNTALGVVSSYGYAVLSVGTGNATAVDGEFDQAEAWMYPFIPGNISSSAVGEGMVPYLAGGLRGATVDDVPRMFYSITATGVLERVPLAVFNAILSTNVQACRTVTTGVDGGHDIMVLPTGFAVVRCITDEYSELDELVSVRIANCTSQNSTECTSDPYYCLWNVYEQHCVTRIPALADECAGDHCTGIDPSIYQVDPMFGSPAGGYPVNITVTPRLWNDSAVYCTFDDIAVLGVYDEASHSVLCTAPAVTEHGVYAANVRYKDNIFAPTDFVPFVFLDPTDTFCYEDLDCASLNIGCANYTCTARYVCAIANSSAACDDGIACTVDTCNATSGICAHDRVACAADVSVPAVVISVLGAVMLVGVFAVAAIAFGM